MEQIPDSQISYVLATRIHLPESEVYNLKIFLLCFPFFTIVVLLNGERKIKHVGHKDCRFSSFSSMRQPVRRCRDATLFEILMGSLVLRLSPMTMSKVSKECQRQNSRQRGHPTYPTASNFHGQTAGGFQYSLRLQHPEKIHSELVPSPTGWHYFH